MPNVMYVSCQGDDKIVRFAMNPATGDLDLQEELKVSGGPAGIAVDPARRFVYIARRGEKTLSSFRIDQGSGALTMFGTVPLTTDPCWVSTDRAGRFLLAAYYEGRGVTIHRIGDDGALVDPPVQQLETARGAHCFQTDPSNRFAFVSHIAGRGPNEIWQFRFDAATGQVTPNTPAKVVPSEPLGPRHYCFHPTKDLVYFSNEQGSSVTAYRFDRTAGTLTALQTVSTLPGGFSGQNSCSKIQITPSGRFLYAPNRGHNSIAGFAVDAATGLLTSLGQTPSEPVPRAFALDPDARFLYSAGIDSGRLAAFRVNSDTGALEKLRTYPVGARPMWVTIIKVGG